MLERKKFGKARNWLIIKKCLDTRQSEILTNFLQIARLTPLRT